MKGHGKRGGANRIHDPGPILDRWAAGEGNDAIARALGIPPGSVARLVFEARKRGDPRAVRRRGPKARRRMDGEFSGPYWADPRQLPIFPEPGGEAQQ